jgi:hypothetical protein
MQIQDLDVKKNRYHLMAAGELGRILGACYSKALMEIVGDDTRGLRSRVRGGSGATANSATDSLY